MSGRRVVTLLVLVLLALPLAGCGGTTSDPVSPLAVRLAQIDGSLAARHFEDARRDLAALAAQTKAARAAGDLSDARADAILGAIVALRGELPVTPAAAPTPTATAEPTPTIAPTQTRTEPSPAGSGKEPGGKGKGAGKGKGR